MRSRLGTALMGVACSIAIVLTGTACDDNDDSKALATFNGNCTVNSATMLYATAGVKSGPHQINWCFSQNELKLVEGAQCKSGDINCIYNAVAAHTPHGYAYAGMFEKNGKPGGVAYVRLAAGQVPPSATSDNDDSDAHKKRKRRKRSNVRQPKKVNPPPVKPPRTSHR